jgi:protein phosphatase
MAARFRAQGKSDVGLVRTNNEDTFLTLSEASLFAVCDGLGGHAAGEIASGIARETLVEKIGENSRDPAQTLTAAIEEANRRILSDQQTNPERIGMGTTLSALWVPSENGDQGWIGHIGDSRIYRLRSEKIDQITEDHSPIFRLYKEGSLGKEELRYHPQKNLIERSLGLSTVVNADVFSIQIEPGDLYLLCTDGLSDLLSDDEIAQACCSQPWENLLDVLIGQALECGGFDNVTIVVVEWSNEAKN